MARSRGQNDVVKPFAAQLNTILTDGLKTLKLFTTKGFLNILLSGDWWQTQFYQLDVRITNCLNGLSIALHLDQLAGQAQVYHVVTDIQKKIDQAGGLLGLQELSPQDLKKLASELGISDVTEFCDESREILKRMEGAVDQVGKDVLRVKEAVHAQDKQFTELKQMMVDQNEQLRTLKAESPAPASAPVVVDLSLWALKETPTIDRTQVLGRGSFGAVYPGSYQGRHAAFKILNFSSLHRAELQREVRIHLAVSACSGVVQIFAVSLQPDRFTTEACVVMERAVGSLSDYIHVDKQNNVFDDASSSTRPTLPPVFNLTLPTKLTLLQQVA